MWREGGFLFNIECGTILTLTNKTHFSIGRKKTCCGVKRPLAWWGLEGCKQTREFQAWLWVLWIFYCSLTNEQKGSEIHSISMRFLLCVVLFLSGSMCWKIKQHPFNLRLSSSPCCDYRLSDRNGNRCSVSKLRIIYLVNLPAIQHTDWESRSLCLWWMSKWKNLWAEVECESNLNC